MKSMIKNVISLFSRSNTDDSSREHESDTIVIVSGYISPDGDEAYRSSLPCNLKRKQAGIFYADIVTYSRLAEQGEEGSHLCLVECMGIMKAHIAARHERLASSEGICVSESAILELDDHTPSSFAAIGKWYVKNISRPVNIFWIEIDAQHYLESSFADAGKISAVA